MKKSERLFLPILLLTFLTSASQAQMSIGLRGGVNFANLSMEELSGSTFKTYARPNFAVLFNYSLSPSLSIQVEPGFSQRGTKISDDLGTTNNNQNIRVISKGKLMLNYIEMPVLFQYKPKFGKFEGIFSLGPELRLQTVPLKAKLNTKVFINGELTEERIEDESLGGEDGFRKFDFGLVGGAGIAYPVGPLKIFAEGRYHFGINNLTSDRENNDLKVHNRGASAHIGVLLPFGTGK